MIVEDNLDRGSSRIGGIEPTTPFPRLPRLNLDRDPGETLHIRRLEHGLERPGGRSRPAPGQFSSLAGVVVIAGKLTY
jgi:hypothetical protein